MTRKRNPELPGHGLLDALHALVLKLDDAPAVLADEMVVMALLVDDLVPALSVVEVPFGDQLTFLEQLQRPVDGGVADVRVDLLDLGVQLFGADMAAQRKEHPRNIVALAGRLQPPLLEAAVEHFHPLVGRNARPARDGRVFRDLSGLRHETAEPYGQRLTPFFLQQPARSRRYIKTFEILAAQCLGQNLDLLRGREGAVEDDEVLFPDLTRTAARAVADFAQQLFVPDLNATALGQFFQFAHQLCGSGSFHLTNLPS